jgi:hypothetical protein
MLKQLLAVLFLTVTAIHATAQPLAEWVPADAVVYIGWRGVDDPDLGYAGSNLQSLGNATDLAGALAQTLDVIERANAGDEWAGLVVELIRSIGTASWHNPTAVYLQPSPDPDMPVRFVMLWQAEGDQCNELLASLQDLVSHIPPYAPLSIGQAQGLVSLSIGTPGPAPAPAPGVTPGDTPAPGVDTPGTGAPDTSGTAAAIVDITAPTTTLAQAPRFEQALTQVQSDSAMIIYADAQGLLSLIDRFAETESQREQEQWLKVRSALGLEGLNAAVWSAGFDGKDWRTELFIDAPAPRTGLLSLLGGEPIADDELAVVPAEATWLAAGRLDLGALLDEARRVIGEIDSEAAQQFEDALLQGNQMTGIDIEADLLRALGSGWIMYTDPGATGSGMMGLCLVNPLKDAEVAERSLVSLQALANAMMGQIGANSGGPGMRIRFHISDDNGMTLNTLGIPFVAPTWSVHDGKLYVGLFPQTVMMAGDRARAGGPTILDNERFQAVMARLDGGEVTSIVYTDLPSTAEDAYQNMVMLTQIGSGMLAMFGGDSVPLLPPYARIEPLLTPTGQVAWADDAGYHSRSISPFPGSVLLGPQGSTNMMSTAPLILGTTLPALGAARRAARQMKSTTQLRGIVQSQVMYASGNNDIYTNDIAELYENNHFSVEYTISPRSGVHIPRGFNGWDVADQKQWVRENASYILIPDLKMDINSETVCVFERPDHTHGGGMAVGFNDGSAQFMMNEWEARELIESQTGKTLEELIERQQNYPSANQKEAAPPF